MNKKILILAGIILIAGLYFAIPDNKIGGGTPEALKLKCDKGKVRNAIEANGEVFYQCLSEEKIKADEGEDISKRTETSQHYLKKKEGKKETWEAKFYSGTTFVKEGDDWYGVDYATTTKDEYDKQTKVSFLEELFGNYAKADVLTASTTAGDGYVRNNQSGTWAAIRTADVGSQYTSTSTVAAVVSNYASSKYDCSRAFLPLDTSGLPDDITISSSSIRFTQATVSSQTVGTQYYAITQSDQPSTDVLTIDDFNNAGGVSSPTEGAVRYGFTFAGGAKTVNMKLNATGISWISPTGVSKFAIRDGLHDIDGTQPADASNEAYSTIYTSEQDGYSQDPYIVIEYTIGGESSLDQPYFLTSTSTINTIDFTYSTSTGATYYNIYRTATSSVYATTSNTYYQDTGLTAETTYDYFIQAGNTSTTSPISTSTSITTLAEEEEPPEEPPANATSPISFLKGIIFKSNVIFKVVSEEEEPPEE